MIRPTEVFHAGLFGKPHGTRGNLVLKSDTTAFDAVDCQYLVCDIDGILVPFFIEEYEFKDDETLFIKLEDIDTSEQARFFTGREVFLPKKYLDELPQDELTWDYFTGFKVRDREAGLIGTITGVDTSTPNTLFVVEQEGRELMIPAVEELIVKVDKKKKEILFTLPQGLLEL